MYTSMFDILERVTKKNKHSLNSFMPILNMSNMDSSSQIEFLHGDHRRKLNMVGKDLVVG